MGNKCCGIHHQFKDMKHAKAQLASLPLHEKQIQMLDLIYTDLAQRVLQKSITLQNFLLFFHKNGFWGQRLFKQFDYTKTNLIVQKQFIIGITKIFKTNEEKKIDLLFKFFSNNCKKINAQTGQKSSDTTNDEPDGISFDNFLTMLYNYPKQDLKKVLNDKQFFQTQIRGSLKIIGQNRRLQSVYKMGSYLQQKKPFQCHIQEKSQVSDHSAAGTFMSEYQPSVSSMVGRNILKHLKQVKAEQTIVKFQDGENEVDIKTNNFHHLVKRFAQRMFKDLKIDIKTQKMTRSQFENWVQHHKKLYNNYYSGFHNQVWELDQSTLQPMYMNCIFQRKAECKYVHPHFSKHQQNHLNAQAILLHTIIILTNLKDLSNPYQTICLDGLTVTKVTDEHLGFGITIAHRNGVYQSRKIYFKSQKVREQWFESLKYFKGQSIENLYTMTKKIGTGKFSIVYQGIEKNTGEKYAIKVIESYKLEQDQKDLIAHETEIMQILSHPLLVHYKSSIQTKTHLYIIAELCQGKDLFQFVKDYRHLDQYNASIITQQIIVGLRYMHSLGIVHRDLKPQNIMVSYENDTVEQIKIIDFGFANYLETLQQRLPQENLAGTPNYIAPQILKRQTLTFKIDNFALGAIIYYMLSGTLPFNDFTLTQIFNKTLDGVYAFPEKLFSKVSKQAKDLIDQLLKNDPIERISLEDALKHPWFELALKKKDKMLKNKTRNINSEVF